MIISSLINYRDGVAVVRYYHTTDAASRILEEGFRDDSGSYGLATFILTGVFIGYDPLDVNEGAIGDDVLELDLPDDLDIGEYELIEEGKEATGNGACQHAF
jgi:hypothetical protein